jgi:glycosyltransferase involved in cell wall biosynthesis
MDSGGPREILYDLPCGKLCSSVHVTQIANALEHFLTMNKEAFAIVSDEATQRAKEFSWDNATQQIEDELMQAIAGSSVRESVTGAR